MLSVYDFSDADLAYAAGIMDGEGYIGITVLEKDKRRKQTSPCFQLVVSVGMTDPQVVNWLSDTFGGNAYSYPPRKSNTRGVFHWRLAGKNAAGFCSLIRGSLKIKQKQADVAIRYYADPRMNHGRHGGRGVSISPDEITLRRVYKAEIQALNQRVGAYK